MSPPTDEQYTMGELVRTLQSLRDSINELGVRFDAYILKEVYEVEQHALRDRLDRVEGNLQWIGRAIGGAVITIVIGALFAGGVLKV